ncbi:MAG TPA: hypothetical protein VMX36_04045 [Sedimentisphaerales bacterium]|nr:hypothetical protein [Sedimentisphaerales bacterium]
MLTRRIITALLMLGLFGVGVATLSCAAEAKFQDTFNVEKTTLADKGSNTYMILKPGYKLILTDGKDTLTITVLDETKTVDGVRTRVVEERETKDGKLDEVSRNYFAIDKATGDIYYFGEDVDMYDAEGKVTGHEGGWLSGLDDAKFGLMMPGKPMVGSRYYQEMAPKVAMDRAEIVSISETVKVPVGTFKNCLKTRESSSLESGVEDKLFAPGVGLLKDGDFKLTKIDISLRDTALPDSVAKTFKATFPNAEIIKVDVDAENGVAVYDLEFKDGATEKETDITPDGTMLEFTIVVDAEDVPAAAIKTVRQAAEGAVTRRIEYIEISYETKNGRVVKLPESVIHYAVEISRGDKTTEIVVNPDGTVVEPARWGDAGQE